MLGKFTLLGTGGSLGIPMIGCTCPVCTSDEPKNQRYRSSALIQYAGAQYLIDAGPDLRQQALQHKLKHLDGLILTHAHNDHTAGIDDLRPLLFRRPIPFPALMSPETYGEILKRFEYFLNAEPEKLNIQVLPEERGEITFEKLPLRYFTYEQGGMNVNGFRFGDLGYVSDIKNYPESIFKDLFGVNILIVSALRHSNSPLHLTVDEAVEFAERCEASKTYLTHISHELDHHKTNAYLPQNVRMAYDGLELDFYA